MSDINSSIGLDATQALATLRQLTTATNQYNSSVSQLTGAFKQQANNSANIAKQLGQIRGSVNNLTTSFGLLSRVVYTQAIVRGLNAVRGEFSATAKDAIAFQRQIGQIRALDTSATFGQIREGVRGLSDDLNISLSDAGAAVEQAVSSQIGPLKDSLDFTRTATQFAKSVGGDAKQAVELLAGTVKSFDMSPLLEADKAASILFKTIDLGNVNADQLATAFGRVGPTASALGVSLEETGAAISTISIRGSNTAETLTQIRGIMSGLIKPSEKMREILAKLGFETGESAVKTLGLEGVLRAIAKETGGSTAALGQLFPNVRALNGELSLSNDEFVGLADAIKQMKAAGRGLSNEAYKVAIDSDAERVTKELNKLKNAAITTFGEGMLSVADGALKALGGADNLVASIRDHVSAVSGLFKELSEGKNLAAGLLGPLSIPVRGIANTIDRKQLEADVLKPLEFRIQINDRQAQAEIARVKDQLDQRAAADKQATSATRKEVAARVAEYNKELARIEEIKKRVAPDATDSSIQRLKDQALSNFRRNAPLGLTDPSGADSALNKLEKSLADKRNQTAQTQIDKINFERMKADGVDAFRVLESQGVTTSGKIGEAFGQLQGKIKLAVVTSADQQQVKQLLEDATKISAAISNDPAAKREFGDALAAAGLAIGKLNDLSLASQVEQSKSIRENLEAASRVQFQSVGGAALQKALGGRIDYRALGGRGSDTIPTMLSRGEYVMNARSARQFFPQLHAMNAGQNPVYRQDGGTVNNNQVSVGDISINAPTKALGAKDITDAINRGIRSGVARIRS